jgi:hypothetical protein
MYHILLLSMLGLSADQLCFRSDIQEICCPAACATKHSARWTKADDVLRSCMYSLGCSDKNATVSMMCNCNK